MDAKMPRWKERLTTFDNALKRLTEVVEVHHQRGLNELNEFDMKRASLARGPWQLFAGIGCGLAFHEEASPF